MADEQVVDSQVGDVSSTTDTKVVPAQQQSDSTVQRTTPPAAGARPAEDPRIAGMLADLQKERKSRQAFETQVTERNAELALERRRIQALTGVNPRSAEETDNDAIRARLQAVMGPDFGSLSKEELAELRELKASAAELKAENARRWESHGQRMLDATVEAATKEMGGVLTDRQQTRLRRAYVQEAENDATFLARHDAGDPKLVTEFVKTFLDDFFEPARRKVLSTESARQRQVPGSRDRSVVSAGGKKVDFSNDKEFGDALVESFRKHGGAFGE